ncbi:MULTISPECIES: hypothetical protein [Kribbella]|nr:MULTISPECIES: hypothetical protein [Kribbella]
MGRKWPSDPIRPHFGPALEPNAVLTGCGANARGARTFGPDPAIDCGLE